MGVSESRRKLTLPNDDKIRILAVSVAEENPAVNSAQALYDTLNSNSPPLSQK
jgi:alpha-mannosidase